MPQGHVQASSAFLRIAQDRIRVDDYWRGLDRPPEQLEDVVEGTGQGPGQGPDKGCPNPDPPPGQDVSPADDPIQAESDDMIEDWPPNIPLDPPEFEDADIRGGGGGGGSNDAHNHIAR